MQNKPLLSTTKPQETAILVGLISQKQNAEKTKEYLDELAFLAETSGVKTMKVFVQRLNYADQKTFVGKGKLEEIQTWITINPVDTIIFDDELSPSQVRNLEKAFENIKVLDRSLLILNIFSQRAQSDQAKRQVELAQYKYLLPRLTRMWSHLSKQKGGIGMRGPGEKELETDKRIVQDRIALLKEKLEKIDKQSATRRKERNQLVRVALVGYTNVGKSTLMQKLAKTEVFAENKLFATIDSTVRKMVLGNIPFLITDTVGFIRKLPTTLIESFKSTLDEIRDADILLHVVDISHDSFEEQIDVVNATLADINAKDKPTVIIFNKLDQYRPLSVEGLDRHLATEEDLKINLERLKTGYLQKNAENVVFISATKNENITELRDVIFKLVKEKHFLIYPNWDAAKNVFYEWQDETEVN
ncbi:GTPase HflX [Lacihabitans sp. CS3-21]|uniref:GTPase HflX n=1 Tax=Lacihabitans sp. CS3-21 TaxID=2487332 RepID=UPI000BD752AF|nr:GTPase HflX [Lacihabitans sp. CS3-21]MCF8323535.1 GTPase HflX [Leadbetterella sp.]MCP9745690.1 GTPase HflX [Lacihabitans sp. CS3-21]OYU67193.1 MAG: GTPase HflX [Cytophagaceae bacterium BCCC1]